MAEDSLISDFAKNTNFQLPSKLKPEERIKTFDKWFVDASEVEKEFWKQAQEDERFYFGDQWDEQDKEKLREDFKPALTYNHIHSTVNVVNGWHRQNRLDHKVFPKKGGVQQIAEVMTAILKHIKQSKSGEWEVSYMHLMGLVSGKAFMSINMDYDDDPIGGDLFYEYNPCFNILLDPYGTKYDLSDRDYMFRMYWAPIAKILRLYPEVKEGMGQTEYFQYDRQRYGDIETFTYKDAKSYSMESTEEIETYRFRIKEVLWKEWVKQKFIIDTISGEVHAFTDKDKRIKTMVKVMNQRAGVPRYKYLERWKHELRMSRYLGNTELETFDSVMGGMRNYPIVPFYPYFVRSKHYGMVTQLKDAQREHNKRMSQALHHLNSSASSGYIADDDAVPPDQRTKVERDISKTGSITWVKKGSRFERQQPAQLSQGHVVLAQAAENEIKMISGVNSDMLGQDQKETVSGVAIARRQAAALVSTEIVQDNLKLTLKVLGDRTIEAVQRSGAFSREEAVRLVIDGKEREFNLPEKMQAINQAFGNITVGKYETYISTAPGSPTNRFSNYLMLLEAMKLGIPVPPDVLLDASDLPGKEKIQRALEAQMKAQQEAKKLELAEEEKDRQLEREKIKLNMQSDLAIKDKEARDELIRDVQKSQLEAVKDSGKEK